MPANNFFNWTSLKLHEKSEDTKRIIKSRKSKNDGKLNVQKKKDQWTNNNLQNITQKTKDRVTRTSLKLEVNSCAPEGEQIPASYVSPVMLLYLVINED